MITEELYTELKKITAEEERILSGRAEIEKDIYMLQNPGSTGAYVVDAKKLLDVGKLIQVRPHTRFVHFPRHTHNYVEMIYMCCGSTHHVIDGEDVLLQEGEILVLNQKAQQEIYPAAEEDIAVNFIILPEFFDHALKMTGEEKNRLRDFVVGCLTGENEDGGYMHFKVAGMHRVGSGTRQGADSTFLEDTLWRIAEGLRVCRSDYLRWIAGSFLISADNAHAVHPNHPEKADPTNRPYLNGGIVIKYHGSQKYATDAVSAARMKELCRKAGVPFQAYANRSDIPGGSTLGNLSTAHVSVSSVDIGLPQLAMHSAVETGGAKDTRYAVDVMKVFYGE